MKKKQTKEPLIEKVMIYFLAAILGAISVITIVGATVAVMETIKYIKG